MTVVCGMVSCVGPRAFPTPVSSGGVRQRRVLRSGKGASGRHMMERSRAYCIEDVVYTYVAAAGDVEAPSGALLAAALGISALVLLIPFALKPGIDAAEQMQERDAKSGRWRK